MATILKRDVERVVEDARIRGRPLVARMTRVGVQIKRKGERWESSGYTIPWDAIYFQGARLKAAATRAAPKRRRLANRGLLTA